MALYKGHMDEVCMMSMGILIVLVKNLYLYLCSSMSLLKSFP